MRAMYLANLLVAGWISLSCIFAPRQALTTVFQNTLSYSESIRLVGALWLAIFILSGFGLFYPRQMQLVFVFQLIYKSSWLLFVGLPAILAKNPYPKGMASFFVVWVVILPFIIDWKAIFAVQ